MREVDHALAGSHEAAIRAPVLGMRHDDAVSQHVDSLFDDIFPFLRRYFQNIAMGEVAKSAEMAREMGYLRASDRIVLNRFELLHVAKAEATALTATGYWESPLAFSILTAVAVAGFAALVGLVVVALMTIITVIAAALYNVFSELVGGIEVTLVEAN